MQEAPPRDIDITDPAHWKGWLAVGALGFLVSVVVGVTTGMSFLDVVLLKEPALAFFLIPDYVFFGVGVFQAGRVGLQRLRGDAT
jgi:hypothetical protein